MERGVIPLGFALHLTGSALCFARGQKTFHRSCFLHPMWDTWSRRNAAPLQYITLDLSTGLKITGQQIGGIVKELYTTSLGPSQAALRTSYSWR